MIRALEVERDALKGQITEALQHEPPDGPNGEQYVDYDGMRVELCSRARWQTWALVLSKFDASKIAA